MIGKRFTTLWLALFIVIVAALLLYPVQGVLLIGDKSAQELWVPLNEDRFMLEYTHSVDMMQVYEIYFIADGKMFLQETHFYHFGVGMGETPGRGEYLEEDGMLKIVNINERVESFSLHLGIIARPKIISGQIQLDLPDMFGEGTVLHIHGEQRTAAAAAFYYLKAMLGKLV